MINKLIKIVSFCALILLINGCNENSDVIIDDENTVSELPESNADNFFGTVSIDKIHSVVTKLSDENGKSLFDNDGVGINEKQKGKNRKRAIFDKKNIIQIADSTQAISYSFYFIYADTPESVFYNLVVKVLPDGTQEEPFILKFESDSNHFEEYKSSNFDYNKFTGTIGAYKFVDFFPNHSVFGKSECAGQHDQYGDPCAVNTVYNGSGGGSASAGSSGGNKTKGCTTWSFWQHCGGSNTNQAHNSQVCGGPGGNGAGWVTVMDCGGADPGDGNTKTKKGVDCANCNASAISGVNASSRTKALVGRLRYKLKLTNMDRDYLLSNPRLTETINSYVSARGVTSKTKAVSKSLIRETIAGNLIATFPYIKYPKAKAKSYNQKYPKFTEYLKNQLPKVRSNAKIINALKEFSGLSFSQIQAALQWDDAEGPEINIIQLDNYRPGETNSDSGGYFDERYPDKIFIDIDLVNDLETKITKQSEEDALLFWLGTTVLHEIVHWGDFQDGVDFPGEEGRKYEIRAYGENVQPDRARIVLDRLKK